MCEVNNTIFESINFFKLISEHGVYIPRLQRDYAYGRKGEEEKRNNFLLGIREKLAREENKELDFIYGTVKPHEGINYVELLDGQQRITNLFLLHWYLAIIGNPLDDGTRAFDHFRESMQKNGKMLFVYATRQTSKEFCKMLITMTYNGIDFSTAYSSFLMNKEDMFLSDFIRDEKWFLPNWQYDPTIDSMLNMLDTIHEIFNPDVSLDYYKSLVDDNNKTNISFKFMNLGAFELSDELYIKMNSRGKGITRFENLKTIILALYDEAKEEVQKKIQSNKSDRLVTIYANYEKKYGAPLRDYISNRMDREWTDLFWQISKNNNIDIDTMMLNFIYSMSIYDNILHYKENPTKLGTTTKHLLESISDGEVTVSYGTFKEILKADDYMFLFHLIDYFDAFLEMVTVVTNGNTNHLYQLKTYYGSSKLLLPPKALKFLSREENVFENLTSAFDGKKSYYERIWSYLYIRYIIGEKNQVDEAKLCLWLRFACNIIENSVDADNEKTFGNLIVAIDKLCELAKGDVKNAIKNDPTCFNNLNLSAIEESQIEEEVLKIQISQKDLSWGQKIDAVEEKLAYFDGRLSFFLSCCGINSVNSCDSAKISSFEKFTEIVSYIFPDEGGSGVHECAFIKAMLSQGDYLLYYRGHNTLGTDANRDTSWRTFFSKKPEISKEDNLRSIIRNAQDDVRIYLKNIVEALVAKGTVTSANIEAELVSYANTECHKNKTKIPMWRQLLIEDENLDKILGNSDISSKEYRSIDWNHPLPIGSRISSEKDLDNYEIDILRNQLNHSHAEIFSLCKFYELENKFFGQSNNYGADYQYTSKSDAQPYLSIKEKNNSPKAKKILDEEKYKVIYIGNGQFDIEDTMGNKIKTNIEYHELDCNCLNSLS